MKYEAFWPCIDSSSNITFKAQKGSKDIVNIFIFVFFAHKAFSS